MVSGMTNEEIAAKKARIRRDPHIKNICRMLGITMEQLLDGIEEQWADPKVASFVDAAARERLMKRYVERVRVVAKKSIETNERRTHRRSVFGGLAHEAREEHARIAIGDDY